MSTIHLDVIVVNVNLAANLAMTSGDWASAFGHELVHEWQFQSRTIRSTDHVEEPAYKWQIDNLGKFGPQQTFSIDGMKRSYEIHKKDVNPMAEYYYRMKARANGK